jgi:hypothetical protein
VNFEDLQNTWRSQDAGATVTINVDVLLKEVRRNERQLRATIFWRDVREVGAALALAAYFAYQSLHHHQWAEWVVAAACLWVGAFMGADRLIQRRKQPAISDSLKTCVETSLHQVNHQIWLLKNVLWWYLLPPAMALGVLISYWGWQARDSGVTALVVWVISALVIGLVYWGIYRLNQSAVRKHLEPRREELETLLVNLE